MVTDSGVGRLMELLGRERSLVGDEEGPNKDPWRKSHEVELRSLYGLPPFLPNIILRKTLSAYAETGNSNNRRREKIVDVSHAE